MSYKDKIKPFLSYFFIQIEPSMASRLCQCGQSLLLINIPFFFSVNKTIGPGFSSS